MPAIRVVHVRSMEQCGHALAIRRTLPAGKRGMSGQLAFDSAAGAP